MKAQKNKLVFIVVLGAVIIGGAALFFFARALLQTGSGSTVVNARAGVIKIELAEDGLYRLTLDELRGSGLAQDGLDVENLRLSIDGRTLPYLLQDEALIFYGQGANNRYSRFGTYLLETGKVGALMAEQPADGPKTPIITVPRRLHLEENTLYDGRARYENGQQNDSQGPWYWDTLQVQSRLPLAFELPEASQGPAVIRMALWGATHDFSIENDHDFDVVLNGQTVDTVRWDGETHFESETTVPAGVLQAGTNELILDNSVEGATLVDIMRLDWIDIVYQVPPMPVGDRLRIEEIAGTIIATGFSGRPLIVDISNPENPAQLVDWVYWADEGRKVELPVQAGQVLMAAGPEGFLSPVSLSAVRDNNWRSTDNQADLLIVTTEQLAPALTPLVEARREQGLESAVVPVEEIYDEFGFGQPTPQAITEFVRYAAENWAEPKPRYLFLVGEGTYDFRGYLGEGPQNIVPSLIIPVNYSGETVSDTRLADIDGDFRPDLAVGRWPVDSREEVTALIERTLAYENGQASSRILFAADGTSPEFSNVSDRVLQESVLGENAAEKLYGINAAQLTEAWNEGAWLVNYTGHGSLDRWGQEDVFSAEAVNGLRTSGPPPIVLQLTCLTGFFAHPTISSLSEEMLLHESGPVLIVSATSLTLSSSQTPFGINLVNELNNPDTIRIGDAVHNAKLGLDVTALSLREISDTFGLLGDPTTVIVRPD